MYTFFVFIFFIIILVLVYLTTRIHKLEIIKEKYTTKVAWTLSIFIVLIGIGLTYFFKYTMVILLIHLAVFFLLGDLVYLILKKIFKVKAKYNIIGLSVVAVTLIYIIYGYFVARNVQETKYTINTTKDVSGINIVQIADVHIGTTFSGDKFNEYVQEISKQNPDAIVVVGDLVDERNSFKDMVLACKALGNAKARYGVYLVFGNHDLNTYGGNKNYTNEQFIAELEKNNVKILQDEKVFINNTFYIIGRKDKSVENRKSIDELMHKVDKKKYIIILDHQPVDFQNNKKAGVDLVLSGHTHGGQMLPLKYIGEYVSSNEMTYGIKKDGDTTYITTSGMSAWGIPVKTGTISEYVNIKIK